MTKVARPQLAIEGVSPALLAKALGSHRTTETLAAAIRKLVDSLDKASRASLLAATCDLARRRGKALPHELETLAACARVAGGAHADRVLGDLVLELRDGAARGSIVRVLMGWQTAMKPAVERLAVLLDDEDVKARTSCAGRSTARR